DLGTEVLESLDFPIQCDHSAHSTSPHHSGVAEFTAQVTHDCPVRPQLFGSVYACCATLGRPGHLPPGPALEMSALPDRDGWQGHGHYRGDASHRLGGAIQTLNQARRKNAAAGTPIECPINGLNVNEVFMRRGQLTLVAAASGVGKSALVQAILQRGNDHGARNSSLYFSADTDETTMWIRAGCIATGYDSSGIEQMIRSDNVAGLEAEVAAATKHMAFVYNTAPSDEDVLREVEAYSVKYGVYPEVIVIDNLMNLYAGEGEEFAALQGNCDFLHTLARQTKAAVIALHHVMGDYSNGDKPVTRAGLRGKIDKTPEVILSLHRINTQLYICPIKNRNGRADPRAEWQMPVLVDLARMNFSG
ncbi:MAG TPA: hypothetical protein DCR15_05675, partial [Arthrobacter bacterium]|nr:hypothetical protein [Arthrobacter sp.]